MKRHWFDLHPDVLAEERERLARTHPGLELVQEQPNIWVVRGRMPVVGERGYTVRLIVGTGYPEEAPTLVPDPNEIRTRPRRHVNPDGTACLCVRSQIREFWPPGSDLADFMAGLVRTYFVHQLYFDDHKIWPDEREWAHGADGIRECYRDRLSAFGGICDAQIRAVLRMLAKEIAPSGREPCPCGSGNRLSDCHAQMIADLRTKTAPIDARRDLSDFAG